MSSTRFPWPEDSSAWWSFLTSLLGGLWLTQGAHWQPGSVGLLVAALCLFLVSDWLSHLTGRSRQGKIVNTERGHPLGFVLLISAGLGGAYFYLQLNVADLAIWQRIAVGALCLLTLIFILRLEWVALDSRLVFLTHLLLTLPALVFGFLHWGVGDGRAYELWLPLAVYFPTQALFSVYWLQGKLAPSSARSLLALPLLLGIVLLARSGSWLLTLFLAAFLARAVTLLHHRQRSPKGLPDLESIQYLGWELHAWNAAFCWAWALRR